MLFAQPALRTLSAPSCRDTYSAAYEQDPLLLDLPVLHALISAALFPLPTDR
jgi:hypothetical protein